jgi:hypothetical protein
LYRFDARAADRMTEKFQREFDQRRALFLQGLRRQWPAALGEEELASTRFTDYLAAYRLAHLDFPLSDPLAREWAVEAETTPLRNDTAAAIREALRQYVIEETALREAAGHAELFLSAPVEAGGITDPARLHTQAQRVLRRVLVSLDTVRAKVRAALESHGDDWAKFASQYVTPNVTFDREFTAAARVDSVKELHVRVEFKPGEKITGAARPVTAVQAAALAALRTHFATAGQTRGWTDWWLAALGAVCLLAGSLARHRPAQNTLTTPSAAMLVTSGEAGHIHALRQGLLQQMAGWLKQHFIQRLIQQRNEALASEAGASEKVQVINERLNRLQPEIQERIAEYERRISDLERELSGANEVNRELIKTRISLARKELEIEKARSNLVWN